MTADEPVQNCLIFSKNAIYCEHKEKPKGDNKMLTGLGIFGAAYLAGMVLMTVKGMKE